MEGARGATSDVPVPASVDARTRRVVADLERAFGVELSHGEAARCTSAEGATEVLVARLGAAEDDDEAIVEKARRRVVVAFSNKGATDMDVPLDVVLPRWGRRVAWWRARRMLGVRLPRLVNHPAVVAAGVVLLALWTYLCARASVERIPPLTAVRELMVVSAALSLVAAVFLPPRPQSGCSRVESVVRRLVVERLDSLAAGRPWTRGRVGEVVRLLHAVPRPPAPATGSPARPVALVACAVLGLLAGHGTWMAGDAVTHARFASTLEQGALFDMYPPPEATVLLARYPPLAKDVGRLVRSGTPPQRCAAIACLGVPIFAEHAEIDVEGELVAALTQQEDAATCHVAAAVLGSRIQSGLRPSEQHLDTVARYLVGCALGERSITDMLLLGAVARLDPVPVEALLPLARTGDLWALSAVATPLCEAGAAVRLLDEALGAQFDATDEDERRAAEERTLTIFNAIGHFAGLDDSEETAMWQDLADGDPARLRAWRDRLAQGAAARRAAR